MIHSDHAKILQVVATVNAESVEKTLQKVKKIGLYKALMNKCDENLQEKAKKGSEAR